MREPKLNVLYEDNHLLVVEKPVNMPIQADASGDMDLLSACRAYIKEAYQKPGEVYLGLVHRLDRPVGGVVVFARTSKAAARLSAQFQAQQAEKRYVAIVDGDAEAEASCHDWLYKDESTNTSRVVAEGTQGAKSARLRYRTLFRSGGRSLVDVRLKTGRPHQIRVQLSSRGLPIVGDQRYNPHAQSGEQIRLWAYGLTIVHPTLKEPLSFYSMPPWQEFLHQLPFLSIGAAASGIHLEEEWLVVDKNEGTEVETDLLCELSTLFETVLPVHRLDANTQGLCVFARTEAMQKRLTDAFYRHETEKVYHAIVSGAPKAGRYVHYARKDAEAAVMRLCEKTDADALRMELALSVLESRGELSLVEIRLFTGRTHQIRVQLAALGHPVLGDDKYGDHALNKRYKKRQQMLLAKRLSVLGKTFESPRELSWEGLC